jgi:oligopeptide/dipeptide ABC transporter ATP-binding protein
MSNRVAVMYLGRIVETAPRNRIFKAAAHPYTQALLSAAPIPDPVRERRRQRIVLTGDVPNPARRPSGCGFRTRCPKAREICSHVDPPPRQMTSDHEVCCHFPS